MRVFYNGKFISCEEENSIFSVLIEENGYIVYTGNDIPSEYNNFEHINMYGKCVTPCFGDTHLHFTSACLLSLDVRDCSSIPEVIDLMKNFANNNKKDKVVGAFGISKHIMKEKRLPHKNELDIISERPVLLVKYDGHAGVLNSKFIEILPQELKKHGELNESTGECSGEAFQKLCQFAAKIKLIEPSMILKKIPSLMDQLAQLGINLIMPVEGLEGDDSGYDLMVALDRQTPIRVLPFLQTMDIEKAIKKKCKRVGGCFVNQLDGCFGAKDAALKQPYNDEKNNYGWLVYSQEEIENFVKKAHENEIQLALHAIGDAAVEQAVNAFEKVLKDDLSKDHRHAIIHGDLFPKEYIQKAGRLKLYCAVQTPFLTWPEEPLEYLLEVIGDRAYQKHPLPLMLESGITVANGSDHPSSRVNPLMGLYSCCNHPNEKYRVDILTALKMHTLHTAELAHMEDTMGSLTVGKVADFVVFDRDITITHCEDLLDVNIDSVYYGGELYRKNSFKISNIKLILHVLKSKFLSW
ncbi:amidohydrolase family protein [Proteinivorax tanatarense]|uniref:Amidohydrolase family protein n=1 Tax=Proteinivorax tanatarense TaxID=1260629 RepID=A0AAU7VK34_9FIRM